MKSRTSYVAAILLACALCAFSQVPATPKAALFKEWNYSSTGVFGLIKLDNPIHRSYFKIWKPEFSSVKVQQYDSSDILENTIVLRYLNGRLSQITRTNRWGDVYETDKFASAGPGQLLVTIKNNGKNSFLPAKGAKYVYTNNLLSEVRYVSYSNKLTSIATGAAIVRYKRYTDRNRFSLLKEMSFFDENDKPVISKSYDCHKVVYEYDERGNQLSISYYGTENEPLTNRYGGFKSRMLYDANDEAVRSEIIGLDDSLVNNSYGVSGTKYDYKDGLLSKATRFNEKNQTVKASAAGDGIAIIKYEYDDKGNEIKWSCFDESDNPMNSQSGYHQIAYTYSPDGMLIAVAYFDKQGAAVVDRSRIHRYSYVRDDKGRIIQTGYYDKDDKPVKDDVDEVFMVKYRYDDFGREISRSFWQDSDKKMQRWDGYHEQRFQYNDDGQEVESLFYDENGKLFVGSSGYSRAVTAYDSNARRIELKWYNDTTPAVTAKSFIDGYHSLKYSYDENGRISNVRYFDAGGKPVNATIGLEDSGIFYHRVEFVYKGNRVIEQKFYVAESTTPDKIIDCLKNDCVSTNGVGRSRKNQ